MACGLFVAGCGSAPSRPSESQAAALAWNQRGQQAYARGDYPRALEYYRQALDLNRATEDVDGVARELVNLATVHRRLGERDKTRAALDEVLTPGGIPFSAVQRAEASHRLALFAAEDGDVAAARGFSERASVLCGACAIEGAILNFQAGMRLTAGDAAAARALAARALAANRRHADAEEEEANSLRLAADAALALKDYAAAVAGYQAALTLDKRAGRPHKIAADLLGLGDAARAQGRGNEAADYFRRARSVAEAGGDEVMRRAAAERLQAVNP
jgi:tetratricopeptide (TPR) repeat protein